MTFFITAFLIICYLNVRFLVVVSWYRPKSKKEEITGRTQFLLFLPVFALIILGFFLMKWYYFLPLIVLFFFDPVMLFFSKLYFRYVKALSVTIVDNNFLSLFRFFYIAAATLWVNYYFFIPPHLK